MGPTVVIDVEGGTWPSVVDNGVRDVNDNGPHMEFFETVVGDVHVEEIVSGFEGNRPNKDVADDVVSDNGYVKDNGHVNDNEFGLDGEERDFNHDVDLDVDVESEDSVLENHFGDSEDKVGIGGNLNTKVGEERIN